MSRENRIDTIDLVGKRFGNLLVIERNRRKGVRGAYWLCACDCGKKTSACGGHLRDGTRKSCGCIQYSRVIPSSIRLIMSWYIAKSKARGREFSLNLEEFSRLIQGNCYYCNIGPSSERRSQKTKKVVFLYNGIDRIDSSKGYTVDNCVTACRYCNQAKSNLTLQEFKDHIERIYKWLMIDS